MCSIVFLSIQDAKNEFTAHPKYSFHYKISFFKRLHRKHKIISLNRNIYAYFNGIASFVAAAILPEFLMSSTKKGSKPFECDIIFHHKKCFYHLSLAKLPGKQWLHGEYYSPTNGKYIYKLRRNIYESISIENDIFYYSYSYWISLSLFISSLFWHRLQN